MSKTAIDAFWRWWPTASPKISAAIASGKWRGLVDEISERVAAIDKEMHWELGPGLRAAHAMMLSANGDAKLRKKAEAWCSKAPKGSKQWEFHPARQRRPDTILKYSGKSLATKNAWVTATATEAGFGVTIFHSAFAKMTKADRETAAVLLLDGALGEDDVEHWIAGISIKTKKPAFAVPLSLLVNDIDALKRAR